MKVYIVFKDALISDVELENVKCEIQDNFYVVRFYNSVFKNFECRRYNINDIHAIYERRNPEE